MSEGPQWLPARYEQRGVLGSGATGFVYRVFDRSTEQLVALKTVHSIEAGSRAHLKEEFRLLRDLGHPNVVQVLELVADTEHCFFTMELIEGRSFDVAVAGDLERLERLGAQLLEALVAVHSVGLQHRDVKPANALVSADERLVLVDFDLAHRTAVLDEGGASGTAAYMAPETLWGSSHPRSDWYSAGLTLYEALTGELPFGGASARAMHERGTKVPPLDPARGAPTWLGEMITQLLQPEPERRPNHREVLARLTEAGRLSPAIPPSGFGGRSVETFVGRAQELERLCATPPPGGRVVELRGPSGVGKSELVFQAGRALERDGAWVLEGECRAAEYVPHNALDRPIDRLASRLATEPNTNAQLRLEASRLFPALSDQAAEPLADAIEARRRATSSLAELLRELGARHRVVIVVDEAQWADRSSRTLLADLLGEPLGIEWWIVQRTEPGQAQLELPVAAALDRQVLELGPLPREDIAALARNVLEPASARAALVERIVEQAEGSPLLATALAHHSAHRALTDERAEHIVLPELVHARVTQLGEAERSALAIAAAAGRPLSFSLLSHALSRPSAARAVRELERYGLVRNRPAPNSTLSMVHPRIGAAVLSTLGAQPLRHTHERLALAYTASPNPEPAIVYRHFAAAERPLEARRWALDAARVAETRLAFEEAADFYGRALELDPHSRDLVDLQVAQARAYANAGLGEAAAHAYTTAANQVEDSDRHQALMLDAAEQLVRSGRADAGTPLLDEQLRLIGLSASMSPRAALFKGLGWRLRFFARGHRFRRRVKAEVDAATHRRLELLWRASHSLAMTEFTVAHALGGRFLIEALRHGDIWQVARALGSEATFEAALGGRLFERRAAAQLERMRELVTELDEPFPSAMIHGYRGVCDWNRGRWRSSTESNLRCVDELLAHVPGKSWEVAIGRIHAFTALAYQGEFARLAQLLPPALEDAQRRGDLFAANFYRLSDATLFRLAAGEVDEAAAAVAAAEASWPHDPYHLHRYHHFNATIQIASYRGDAEGAWAELERLWPMIQAGQFLVPETPGAMLRHLRGRVALARATLDAPLRKELRRLAAAIARTTIPPAQGLSASLRAGLAAREGDDARAARELEQAIAGFDAADMGAMRELCRIRLAALSQAPEPQAAVRWLEDQGVRQIPRMARLLVPGFDAPQ